MNNQTPLNLSTSKPNILLIENLQIKKKCPKLKYTILYTLILFSLYLPFLFNYLLTSKGLKANSFLYIPADYLCNNAIEALNKSLKANISENYIQKNNEAEKCFNKAVEFNKKCFMYLSEVCLCKAEKKKCSWVTKDLKECSFRYNFTNVNDIIQYCDFKY